MNRDSIAATDQEIALLLAQEKDRQQKTINLIASENYTSSAVREATGSLLSHKYAEGYPGKRYYGGCRYVDQVETLAIERAKKIFNAEHVNVQPHSGSQANMAAYAALLQPGDTILGMSLVSGGHLTHGHSVNFSGTLYKSIHYGVNQETGYLDYNEIQRLAYLYKPRIIVAGASAYSRAIDFERFYTIAQSVNAYLMADIAHIAGLVATSLHQSPLPYADIVTSTTHKTLRGPRGGIIMCKQRHANAIDKAIMPGLQGGPFMNVIAAKAVAFKEALEQDFRTYQQFIITNARAMVQECMSLGIDVVTGGTDNHLFIIDLRSKNISGRAAELLLESIGITVSRSCIPNDPEKPWITSGIRIGTPAITTRAMRESEAAYIIRLINSALDNAENPQVLATLEQHVKQLCYTFPIKG